MKGKVVLLGLFCFLWSGGKTRADFKYTESAKITGGMMASMMRVMGGFGQEAEPMSRPMESTTYVKGDRLRRDEPTGKIEIINLDKRWIIGIDTQSRTYSFMSFDEMRRAVEERNETLSPQGNSNVSMVPKIEFMPMATTKTILNHGAREVKIRMHLEMQSQGSQQKAQPTSFWYSSVAWVTYSVPGYEEVRTFYARMGRDLNWIPGQMFGGASGVSPAMAEFRNALSRMRGFPLVQTASFGASDNDGRPSSNASRTRSSGGSSFLDMTIEVTSFSDNPLNENLFGVPAGYTRVEQEAR